MGTTPTHHIKHVDGWEADIYIAPTLQAQLENAHTQSRLNARASVSIAFREACNKKHGDTWRRGHKYVEWRQLTVTILEPARGIERDDEDDNWECDECPMCETGYHERCRNRHGCPNARLR